MTFPVSRAGLTSWVACLALPAPGYLCGFSNRHGAWELRGQLIRINYSHRQTRISYTDFYLRSVYEIRVYLWLKLDAAAKTVELCAFFDD